MMPPVEVQRAIRREYREKTPDGHWRYRLPELAARYCVSENMVRKIAKTWGLSRYLTRGAA